MRNIKPKRREPCAIKECDRPTHCRGFCLYHYARWKRGIDDPPRDSDVPPVIRTPWTYEGDEESLIAAHGD
jgi:hypothetical protein